VKAASISSSLAAFRIGRLHPFVRAASCASFTIRSLCGLSGFTSRAITLASGTNSESNSIRLGSSSAGRKVRPVTLPPGWARLATWPSPIALPPPDERDKLGHRLGAEVPHRGDIRVMRGAAKGLDQLAAELNHVEGL
jgi:hypothetical protein